MTCIKARHYELTCKKLQHQEPSAENMCILLYFNLMLTLQRHKDKHNIVTVTHVNPRTTYPEIFYLQHKLTSDQSYPAAVPNPR